MSGLEPIHYQVFVGLLVATFIVGCVVAVRLSREVEEDGCPTTEADLLRDIERGYFSGTMTREEFERAKALIPTKLAPEGPRRHASPRLGEGVDSSGPPRSGETPDSADPDPVSSSA